MKCQICHENQAEWAWQPFGPDDDATRVFTDPGSHYRGFPVVKTCEDCRQKIKSEAVIFTYKHVGYVSDPSTKQVKEAPF